MDQVVKYRLVGIRSARIARLVNSINNLLSQPQFAHDQAQANLGSPIMNLNADVLREIFLFCLFRGPARIPLVNRMVQLEPRLVLSHVCSFWRAIALYTPELWSHIDVGRLRRSRHYECLKTWLHRSAQFPLSIHGSISDDLEGVDEFGNIVLSNIHRCRRLTMNVTPILLPTLLCLPPGSLRALVSVNLHFSVHEFCRELQRLAVDTPITAFQMAPQLRCVTLGSAYRYEGAVDLRCLRLPWRQLTILKFEDIELAADSCIAVLHACTALELCKMTIASIDDLTIKETHARTARTVVLPALRILYLSGDVLHEPFLTSFHLPNLRSLELNGDNIRQWSVGILTPILVPTTQTLQVLRIGRAPHYMTWNENAPDQDVHTLLELLPHLTECIVDTAVHWKSSALNAIRDGECGVWLETLCVGIIDAEELLEIAEGRLRASLESAGAISVVSVLRGRCTPPPREDSVTERVQALQSVGVRVYFDSD
ncbi:hypothetical protein BD779DRAFT_1214906 [Infundibulicybe gibba]|nr:hypothetical protein BD779DRAFT_1214906 [Infundibulicybe gibba]